MEVRKPLSPRQSRALQFIRDYIQLHGRSPSMAEVATHLEISPPAAHQLIVRLEQLGYIRKEAGVPRSLTPVNLDFDLERQSKGMVLLAFRNGPIEDLHAGSPCPKCAGKHEYSKITEEEMKLMMKTAVNRVFSLLKLRRENTDEYERLLRWAELQTKNWDAPELTLDF